MTGGHRRLSMIGNIVSSNQTFVKSPIMPGSVGLLTLPLECALSILSGGCDAGALVPFLRGVVFCIHIVLKA